MSLSLSLSLGGDHESHDGDSLAGLDSLSHDPETGSVMMDGRMVPHGLHAYQVAVESRCALRLY